MEHMSLVKFHKFPRRLLLTRRNLARIPIATTRYIHQSAGFATLMSDLGLEGIGNYVRSMKEQEGVLRQMSRTGTVDARTLAVLVETVSNATKTNCDNLNLITNSLIRFRHTGAEPVIRPRLPGRQAEDCTGRDDGDAPEPMASSGIPGEAAAGCDAHE
jgi:hypothetical protein